MESLKSTEIKQVERFNFSSDEIENLIKTLFKFPKDASVDFDWSGSIYNPTLQVIVTSSNYTNNDEQIILPTPTQIKKG